MRGEQGGKLGVSEVCWGRGGGRLEVGLWGGLEAWQPSRERGTMRPGCRKALEVNPTGPGVLMCCLVLEESPGLGLGPQQHLLGSTCSAETEAAECLVEELFSNVVMSQNFTVSSGNLHVLTCSVFKCLNLQYCMVPAFPPE